MTSKEVLGSNPLACKGKPCLPFATELDLGLPMGLLVGSAVVLNIYISLSLHIDIYINPGSSQEKPLERVHRTPTKVLKACRGW